ncbi:Synaptobrevin-like protein YKT6 [Yarrowia sp. B02]|nr:Synaptobrevin-like protein YKT6 [Yarrowia sp. B02]
MKLYYIGILRPNKPEAVQLASASDLSSYSWFERSTVGQAFTFLAETVIPRTEPGQRQSVEENDYVGHAYLRSDGLGGVIITDQEYPVRVAYTLLNKVLEEYLTKHPKAEWENAKEASAKLAMPELEDYVKRYQDPHQADAIMRVQQELDETKIVLHKTIESVLARGERLDTLVDKSEALSQSSKIFFKQAKKTNSCCIVM